VTDYRALADKLRGIDEAVKPAVERPVQPVTDVTSFYAAVKARIDREIEKANVELRQRRLPIIERIFMPAFHGRLGLTFGTSFLCNVELREAKGQITAVISGPPHGTEIARKEYFLSWRTPGPRIFLVDTEKVSEPPPPEAIAAEIVSALLIAGVSLTQHPSPSSPPSIAKAAPSHDPRLYAELWTSLTSVLKSYTVAHGLNADHFVAFDQGEDQITIRDGDKFLSIKRQGPIVAWKRENGASGRLEFTDHGRLLGPDGEQELDLAAESWARELMQDEESNRTRRQA